MPPDAPPADDPQRGLSAAEAAARAARGEVNRPPRSGWAEYRAILARNLFTLFNAMVAPAAVALFVLGDYRSAWAVSAMAVINTLIGLVQELRAKRHLDTLAVLAEPKARVRRDGAEHDIPAGDVVRGDLLLLAAGEAVVADGTVLAAQYLEVDEALLTGESDPVPRRPGDRLLSGSVCVAGEGSYRADEVGAAAFAHRLAAEARQYRHAPGPLQRVLDTLIRALTAIAVGLCLLYVGLFYLRGFPTEALWQMIAATVTSMVPQGLVLMATLALTLGAVRLSLRGAVVQRLSAVEAMASVDVLCMDKTGTLTTSRLVLDRVHALELPPGGGSRAALWSGHSVTGKAGHGVTGPQSRTRHSSSGGAPAGGEEEARRLLRLFAWASMDASSKTVAALREALGELDGPAPEVLDQVPFKSQNRYSAVWLRHAGEEHALALGAFEALQPLLEPSAAPAAEAAWRELLPTGLRLLLLAEARRPDGSACFGGSLAGCALRPLALVALSDELRPEAGEVLAGLAAQGIDFKVLSGDNPETVRATIANLPLGLARGPLITGDQLESAAERARLIEEGAVFGRVAPHQKLDIVTELQRRGRRVGMIGDGVNDVLPIKRADLGIAMGAGSRAARTVADLVLKNNDFALLPRALEEGRTILHNLRRAGKLFLLKNVYTLLLIVVGLVALGREFPYLPQQVTLLNMLTIGGPAFLIMLGRAGRECPPRGRFLREVGLFALMAGLFTGAGALFVWLRSAAAGADVATQRTLLLTMLVLTGLGNVLIVSGVGAPNRPGAAQRQGTGREGVDRRLVAWVCAALPAFLAALYVPPLAYFFALTPLSANQWLLPTIAAAAALLPCALAERLLTKHVPPAGDQSSRHAPRDEPGSSRGA